ncbi:integrase core domain-containing protein [Dickeya poaceiphila]|nr:integrase core domain-containing protein [Dickeya poaceiphila]
MSRIIFCTLAIQEKLDRWRRKYNHERTHSSLMA